MRYALANTGVGDPMIGPFVRARMRSFLFATGDCLFLVFVGAAGTLEMHLLHELGWMFAIACLTGMVFAMVLQMILALIAAPVLGSIETMVPSMILAMLSPMTVCVAHLMGCDIDWTACAVLGAAAGLSMFVFVQAYAFVCRSLLSRTFPCRTGLP